MTVERAQAFGDVPVRDRARRVALALRRDDFDIGPVWGTTNDVVAAAGGAGLLQVSTLADAERPWVLVELANGLAAGRSFGSALALLHHIAATTVLVRSGLGGNNTLKACLNGHAVAALAGWTRSPNQCTLRGVPSADGFVAFGRVPFVANCGSAQFIVLASDDGLMAVDRGWPGVRAMAGHASVAPALSLGVVELDGVFVPSSWHLKGSIAAARAFDLVDAALSDEALAQSALGLKLAAQAIEEAWTFLSGRASASGSIADLQVVRHCLVDMVAELRIALAHLNAVRLSWAECRASAADCTGVRSVAAACVPTVLEQAAQLLGGRGFLLEHWVSTAIRDASVLGVIDDCGLHAVRDSRALALGGVSPSPDEEFRDEVRRHLDELIPDEPGPIARRFELSTVLRDLGTRGLIGITVPKEHGGRGRTLSSSVILVEELARRWVPGVAASVAIEANCFCPLVAKLGRNDSQWEILRGVVAGDLVASLALTEPAGGSFLLQTMQTVARRETEGWVLDGEKMFITNAPTADVALVLARTSGSASPFGLTFFLVPMGTSGVALVRELRTLGLHGSPIGHFRLDGVFVPDELRLGPLDRAFLEVSSFLGHERVLVAAGALAGARRCVEVTGVRLEAGEIGGENRRTGDITELVRLDRSLAAAQAFVRDVVKRLEENVPTAADVCIAKANVVERAQRAVRRCLEIHGAEGLFAPAGIADVAVDSRVLSVLGGTSETMRDLAASFVVREVRAGMALASEEVFQ